MRAAAGGLGGLANMYAALDGDGPLPSAVTAPRAKPAAKAAAPAAKRIASRSPAGRAAASSGSPSASAVGKKAPAAAAAAVPSATKKAVPAAAAPAPKPATSKAAAAPAPAAAASSNPAPPAAVAPAPPAASSGMLQAVSEDSAGMMMRAASSTVASFTEQEDAMLRAQVREMAESVRKAGKPFVDAWPNAEEAKAFTWKRAEGHFVVPPAAEGGFPACVRTMKMGSVGDCWLASVVQALAAERPELVSSLFMEVDGAPGLFAVRLWDCAKWRVVFVDDRFPANPANGHWIFSSHENVPCIALPLIEKAVARLWGGYGAIHGGTAQEAMITLTGLPCTKLRLDARHVPEAQLATKLLAVERAGAVVTASCGGGPQRDAAARKLQLRPQHSYAVLETRAHPTTGTRGGVWLLLSDPHGKTDATSAASVPPAFPKPALGGSFWIELAEFYKAFVVVVVCHTLNYAGVAAAPSPVCAALSSFLPTHINKSSCVFFSLSAPCAVFACAAQQQVRNTNNAASINGQTNGGATTATATAATAAKEAYFDIGVWLFELKPNKAVVLRAVSDTLVDRMTWVKANLEAGVQYVAVPFSVNQGSAPRGSNDLGVSVLAVAPSNAVAAGASAAAAEDCFHVGVVGDAGMAWLKSDEEAARCIHGNAGKALVSFVAGFKEAKGHPRDKSVASLCNRAFAHKEYADSKKQPLFETLKAQFGFLFLGVIKNLGDSATVHVTAKNANNKLLTTLCHPDNSEWTFDVRPGESIVGYAAVAAPFRDDGSTVTMDGMEWTMKVNANTTAASSSSGLPPLLCPVAAAPAAAASTTTRR